MRCPRLEEIPPAPAGRSGWPWTEASTPLPDQTPTGDPWPLISIVTTNYNYGRFIEETIRSVLLQGYPNLEYVVIDGGSTDDSVEILRKYEKWLSFWVSEKDTGQAQGVNKGITRCRGEIFNWLNSDDQLQPGALVEVGRRWRLHQPDFLLGEAVTIEASSRRVLRRWKPRAPRNVLDFLWHSQEGLEIAQPSAFLRLSLVREVGGVREELQYVFDWALYLQLMCARRGQLKIVSMDAILSRCLSHPQAKMIKDMPQVMEEAEHLCRAVLPSLHPLERFILKQQMEWNSLPNQISRSMAQGEGQLPRLLRLLLRHPQLVFSRFYWGAMRRAI